MAKLSTNKLLAYFDAEKLEAGCDEAGRGCLAGPVFAASVILKKGFSHPLLNDSKQISEAKRYEARTIIEAEALAWAVGICTPKEIDKINCKPSSTNPLYSASFFLRYSAVSFLKPHTSS